MSKLSCVIASAAFLVAACKNEGASGNDRDSRFTQCFTINSMYRDGHVSPTFANSSVSVQGIEGKLKSGGDYDLNIRASTGDLSLESRGGHVTAVFGGQRATDFSFDPNAHPSGFNLRIVETAANSCARQNLG